MSEKDYNCECSNTHKMCSESCERNTSVSWVSTDSTAYDKTCIHAAICDSIKDLYARKNHDYGDSVKDTFDKFGIDAFLVRMYDKINRVYTLTRKDASQKVADEKVTDTLLDLANYSIIALTEIAYKKQTKE